MKNRMEWAGRAFRGLLAFGVAALAGCGTLDSRNKPRLRKTLLDLRITEIHYHPADQDTIPGDEYEFVEIKNTGSTTLSLAGAGFTDGIEFTFAKGDSIEAGKFLVLAANPVRFQERYAFSPFGTYTGRLNNAGEKLALKDIPAESDIATVVYADEGGWPVTADGAGYSLVPLTASSDASAASWRASFRIHGSPGKDDAGVVVLNEISTHTDPPASDAIELYNPNDAPMDLGGWFLSDKRADPMKFRIPAGTSIPAKGYVVFEEKDFNKDTASAASFNLSSHGEEIWLSADSMGCATGYCHGFSFGEIENGISFGRHVTSVGEEHFVAQKQPSFGTENAGPRIGPVVISEIMYHPVNDTDEYLEIANIGGTPIDLFDRARPANTWKVEGFGFSFPVGVTLAAGEVVLIIPAAAPEDRIRSAHGIPSTLRIFKADGVLNNSADTLELMKPEDPMAKAGVPGDSTVPYMLIDRVTYTDGNPWPKQADGEGPALVRKELRVYGNDPSNWAVAKGNPGTVPAK